MGHDNWDTFSYHAKDLWFSSVLKSKTEILKLKKNSKVNNWTLKMEMEISSDKFIQE